MSVRKITINTKTNFTLLASFFITIIKLQAFPSVIPISPVLLNKIFNEKATKEVLSVGIPIVSSSWAAYKKINDVQKSEYSFDGDVDKETFAAKLKPIGPLNAKSADAFEKLKSIEQRRQYVAWFAESYTEWGFRYKWGGTTIETGIDCSGFTRFVLNYFDYKTPRTAHQQFEEGNQIEVEKARQGDLVFFGQSKEITHVAVVIKNDASGLWVVHSTCSEGIHKENISLSAYWRPKLKKMAASVIE